MTSDYSRLFESSQAVLQWPFFLEQPDPAALPTDGLAARWDVHMEVSQLITDSRRRDRVGAWLASLGARPGDDVPFPDKQWVRDFDTAWRITDASREALATRYPLRLRRAAASLLSAQNQERFDQDGGPRSDVIARGAQRIPMREILETADGDPLLVAQHLRNAGYLGNARVRRDALHGIGRRLVAADALDFLAQYPPPLQPQEGELGGDDLRAALHFTAPLFNSIVDRQDARPVVRIFLGKGGRESEYFTPPAIRVIESDPANIPLISDEEVFWDDVKDWLSLMNRAQVVADEAGVVLVERRVPGQINRLTVRRDELVELAVAYMELTQLGPGEKDITMLSRESGRNPEKVFTRLTAADRAEARWYYPKGVPAHAFPSEVAASLLERLKKRVPKASRPAAETGVQLTRRSRRDAVSLADVAVPEAAPVEVAERAAAEPERQPEVFAPDPLLTLPQLAVVLAVEAAEVNRAFLAWPGGRDILRDAMLSKGNLVRALASTKLPAAMAAGIAQELIGVRRQRRPSVELGVPEIALLSGRPQAQVVALLHGSGRLPAGDDWQTARYAREGLDSVLELLK